MILIFISKTLIHYTYLNENIENKGDTLFDKEVGNFRSFTIIFNQKTLTLVAFICLSFETNPNETIHKIQAKRQLE